MSETDGTLSRREAIMTTAKVVGVAAFAAPVVVGVFSAPAFGATVTCNGRTDSKAILATVATGGYTKNTNCAGGGSGRYNAQNVSFTISGLGGTLQVGLAGVDNFETGVSFYTIENPTGYCCTAKFVVDNCGGTNDRLFCSVPVPAQVGAPYRYSLPYCSSCSSAKLVLQSVYCCAVATGTVCDPAAPVAAGDRNC